MPPMTLLPDTYMPLRPDESRVTVLDTPGDLQQFRLDGGAVEDADGNVNLRIDDQVVAVPLSGLYWVQRIEGGIPVPGSCQLLTKDQFSSRLTVFDEAYFEYGVKFLPRRNDIVVHGSLEAAKAALVGAPVLLASGEYGIVRRLVHEPGDWELAPGVTFDEAETA